MPTENELGWMRKQILKCKLYVTISLYTVYSTLQHSQALDIFGFAFREDYMWWYHPLIIL